MVVFPCASLKLQQKTTMGLVVSASSLPSDEFFASDATLLLHQGPLLSSLKCTRLL